MSIIVFCSVLGLSVDVRAQINFKFNCLDNNNDLKEGAGWIINQCWRRAGQGVSST